MHSLAAPDQCFRLAMQVARTDTCMTSSMAAQMGAQLSKQMPACPPTGPTQREQLSHSASFQLDRACQQNIAHENWTPEDQGRGGGGGSHPCATPWWQSGLPILRMGAGDLSNVLHASGQLLRMQPRMAPARGRCAQRSVSREAAPARTQQDVRAAECAREARHPEPARAQVLAARDALHRHARAADGPDLRRAQPASRRRTAVPV